MRRSIVLFAVSLAVPAAVACSSSKNNSNGNSQEAGASATGLTCGTTVCPAMSDCCYDTTSQPTCVQAGSCDQSYLSCSSKADCASGQTCCFTFDNDAGMATGHFHAQCAASCPASQTAYTLCDPNKKGDDCPSGQMCIVPTTMSNFFAFGGGYAPYCGMNNFAGGFGSFFGDGGLPDFGDGGFAGLFADGGPLSNLFGDGGLLSNLFGDGGFPFPGFGPPNMTPPGTGTSSDAAGTSTPDTGTSTAASDAAGD